MSSGADQLDVLATSCVDVVTRDDLLQRLSEGRPLRVKLGIDPSGPLLHLGHAVVLRQLRAFQNLGHKAILVVGDFTAQIGDPTGRANARKPRSPEQIRDDMQSYAEQASLILDIERAEIRYNSEWLAPLKFADLIGLLAKTTVARMLERDDFTKRYAEGAPIGLHEFMYPISQAYDSVALEADVELGGTEQLFNLMMGRRLQEELGQRPQICMTSPILEGTDGVQRMGKSLDNFVALREAPAQMFGKVMSVPDALLERYWRLAAGVSIAEADRIVRDIAAGALAPRDAKVALAESIVRLYHGPAAAAAARENFERTVVRKEMPESVPAFDLPAELQSGPLAKVLVAIGFASSNREAQRLIRDGAIKIDGVRIDGGAEDGASLRGRVLQKGNHHFVKLS